MAPGNGHSPHDWPLHGELEHVRGDVRRLETKLDDVAKAQHDQGLHLARQDVKLDSIATRLDDVLVERRAEREAEREAKLALQLARASTKATVATARTKRWLAVLKILGPILAAIAGGLVTYLKTH